jgi:pimeloyl-ACP methyl ester carboxylesterase
MNRSLVVALAVALVTPGSVFAGVAATTTSADGVEIAYTVEGSGIPAMVFVHCWCCDASYWKAQVPVFVEDHTVVTIDLAGHGKSGMARDEWTIEAYGADVAAVVEALDLERVILIGHSMGGAVNIAAAKRMPDRVMALVGVDTYQNLERTIPKSQQQQFLGAFKADFASTTDGFVRTMFPEDADSALVEWVADDMASAPPEVGIGSMEDYFGYEVTGFKELEIPIYCINSERYPTDVEAGKRKAYAFSVEFVPGRGHFPHMEDADTFNTLLAEIVDAITGD